MLKRLLSLFMMGMLLNVTSVVVNSKSNDVEFETKVRATIVDLGTGRDARIEVKLRDKKKLKGYISEVGNDGFSLIDDKTGTATHVPYSAVAQVKGRNNVNGKKIALGVAIVAFLTLIAILQYNCKKQC